MGGAALDAVGVPLPEDTLTAVKQFDAILFGAIGGSRSVFPNGYQILSFKFSENNLM